MLSILFFDSAFSMSLWQRTATEAFVVLFSILCFIFPGNTSCVRDWRSPLNVALAFNYSKSDRRAARVAAARVQRNQRNTGRTAPSPTTAAEASSNGVRISRSWMRHLLPSRRIALSSSTLSVRVGTLSIPCPAVYKVHKQRNV